MTDIEQLAHEAPVFPVKAGTKGGAAGDQLLASWKKQATQDPATVRAWSAQWPNANWCLAMGHKFGEGHLFALDPDVKGKQNGIEALRALEEVHGALPATFTIGTPSGGRHLYFTSPEPVSNSRGALPKGVDVRGLGGYVLAPGALVDGKPYEIIEAANPAPAPAWLLAMLRKPSTRAEQAAPAITAPSAEARAVHYLTNEAPQGQAGGRNDTGYKVAARCKDLGCDRDTTFALMGEYWPCVPPLDADELAHVVNSAFTYGNTPQGSAAPEADFKPVPQAPADAGTAWLDPVSRKLSPFDPNASRIGDVFSVAPPAPRFIVPGYLPVACGQENAIGGAGKTTRRMYEGIHIILGRELYGRPILQPGAVLAVTKEDGADIFKYRLHHVAAALNLSAADRKRVAEHFHVLDMTGEVGGRLVNVDRAGNLQATDLAERIYQGFRHEGVAVVGFDPWNLFGPGERFVNDAEASLMAAGALVSRELACNVCYVGHVSKAVGRQGIIDAHSGRGGAAMGDNARFVVSYVQHDQQDKEWAAPAAASSAAARGDLYRLHITKQSYAKRQLEPVWIERNGYGFTVHEGAPIAPQETMRTDGERIKAFVRRELAGGARYMARGLEEQHARYSLSRDRARLVLSWLLAGGGLTEQPLPEAERRGRRTHYLEAAPADIAGSADSASALPGSPQEIFG